MILEPDLTSPDLPVRELVVELGEHFSMLAHTRSDQAERHAAILRVCKALSRTGLDADSLVRFGMQSVVISPLVSWLMLEPLLGEPPEDRPVLDFPAWRNLLGHCAVTVDEQNGQLQLPPEGLSTLSQAIAALKRWVEEAPFSDIINAVPPSEKSFTEIESRPRSASELSEKYSWVYERLAVTDIEQWAETSLHNELRWILHLIPPPVPSAIMEIVSYEERELNRLIARRVVSLKVRNELWDPLLQPLQEQASTFLQQQRFREAGALFEFYERQNPDHPGAKNNRGFCLIPESPEEALHHLKASERAGYSPRSIAVYNSCCCHWSMNQENKILDLSEYYWQRELESEPAPGTLWRLDDGNWHLYREPDARLAIARLAREAAVKLGQTSRVKVWDSRLHRFTD
jgi:hypothetical protein